MIMEFGHQKTKDVLNWFEKIAQIPRCSKNEGAICNWLVNWAKENHFDVTLDKVQNVLIRVPASPGFEKSPIVILQGHVDMVCEKTPDSTHDFTKDPIELVYDGEWLKANKTTLGADNGIALAMAMAIAVDKEIGHPPLELLFTVDEETGLTGARSLEPGFLKGRILINIDSEDEGYFTVGCAGGVNTNISIPVNWAAVPKSYTLMKISAGGMKGGHSGIDINKEKANAIKIMAHSLHALRQNTDTRLAVITGGTAHNAIPRDCEAFIFIPDSAVANAQKVVSDIETILKFEFKNTDPGLFIKAERSNERLDDALAEDDTRRVIDFLTVIPHGVANMSTDIQGLVETSNNLARIRVEDGQVRVLTSQRSSLISRLNAHTNRIEAAARLAGGEARSGDGYPPWPPNMESPLLARSLKIYERLFNKKPVVDVIHAGLECGIIGDRNAGMDMISIGPTLKNPHSPEERVNTATIGKIWDFMAELFKELK